MKKILILSANPVGTSQLRLDKEIREIDEGLRLARYRNRFTICQKWAVRSRNLRRALMNEKPQYVHFCGHGDREGIMLEGENGKINLLSAESLSDLFEQFSKTVECVLLNACYSENQADAINKHISYVIGLNNVIGDKEAIEFAVGFYDGLGAGESIEKAFKFGCIAIRSITKLPDHMMPVLKINPDILIQKAKENDTNTCLVQIILEGDVEDFNETTQDSLAGAVAGILNIDKQSVKIKYVIQGSIRVILELPKTSEKELISLIEKKDIKLKELQKQFRVAKIKPLSLIEQFWLWFNPDTKIALEKYETLRQTLYFWFERKGFVREDIEDFASLAFAEAHRMLEKDSKVTEIKAEKYIFGIAKNKLKEHYRRESKRPKPESLDHLKSSSRDDPTTFEPTVEIEKDILDAIHIEQIKKYLKKCWRKLKKIDRRILSKFRKVGRGFGKHLAKELDMSENKIYLRKMRALERLRSCVEKYLKSS